MLSLGSDLCCFPAEIRVGQSSAQNLSNVEGTETDSVKLICEVSKPSADVTWYKGDEELPEGGRYDHIVDGKRRILLIQDLKMDDAGEYNCRLSPSNKTSANLKINGKNNSDLIVTVLQKLRIITEEIQDVTTKLGESGTLTCGIIGRPLPEIKWYRYGKELIQSRKYKMSSDGRNHSLSILTEEQEDEGLYTCRAINEAGEIETSGKLRLQAAPQFHPGFPLKEKYFAGAGTSLRLHVVYIGRPIPQIMWFYGKKPLNSSENVIIENTESYTHLVVRNVQRKTNAGRYKVQLSNVFGTVDTSLRVEIQGKIRLQEQKVQTLQISDDYVYILVNIRQILVGSCGGRGRDRGEEVPHPREDPSPLSQPHQIS
uniref:Ig-like domain-containing protein n=1 Tax=Seriola dumerili TaxID=41447 RepID=A0A3B4TAD6_SERDU